MIDPQAAVFSFFAEFMRWNTSCWGMEPKPMVIIAAVNATMSASVSFGRNSNLLFAAAWLITVVAPPASTEVSTITLRPLISLTRPRISIGPSIGVGLR